ncbi:MAG: transporter substrate-binding domain-containing protein [Hyphomicrobiales bacterium]|nr:transporter substrate-binding domain-containing protein [Hyphomicrobiales bacterium]MDE2113952.1 transporter substrate-binding domain-containing protein [Hyphomicrobiales bacterium]
MAANDRGASLIWRVIFAICILTLGFANAQEIATQPKPGTILRVATRVLPPFVMEKDGQLTGFSIELWNAIAQQLAVGSQFVVKDALPDLIGEVQSGDAQAGISAVSITSSREKLVDFSHPIFDAGLQIMVPIGNAQPESGLHSLLSLFASPDFRDLMLLMLFLILIPAPFIWLFERRHHENMVHSDTPLGAMAKTLWWTSTTLAGQARDTPGTVAGRIVAAIWMFVGLVFISYFTATITTSLTVKRLQLGILGPNDLAGKTVGSVTGSTGEAYLKQRQLTYVSYPQVSDAISALESNKIAAIVYDAPILLYYATHDGKGKVAMTGAIFRPETYGILFPLNSKWRRPVDEALLKLHEDGAYQNIYDRWFAAEKSAD